MIFQLAFRTFPIVWYFVSIILLKIALDNNKPFISIIYRNNKLFLFSKAMLEAQ